MLFILNSDGYVVALNKAGSLELDYQLSEAIAKHFTELIDSDNIASATDMISKALKEGSSSFEVNLISKFEVPKLFILNLKTIENDNNITRLLGTGKNISYQKNLRAN
ncbi:MAG: hypothetical protein ACUVRG_07990 [Ignavibacterium sp.]|uniref:hypothetical protein n=1 Tax=Ignavibacterium sp. TaxID=2651167 RepID=UPI00404AA85B